MREINNVIIRMDKPETNTLPVVLENDARITVYYKQCGGQTLDIATDAGRLETLPADLQRHILVAIINDIQRREMKRQSP